MSETPVVPSSIQHLDFDPATETEEKAATPRTCQLILRHPYDNEAHFTCGRVAVVAVSLKKPCGHHNDTYYCEVCWAAIESGRLLNLICRQLKTDSKVCDELFCVKPAIVRWERL